MGGVGTAIGVATCLAALLTIAVVRWPAVTPPPLVTVHTHTGERATLRLADGSSVVLGAQSTLRYASHFGAESRDVYLDGEAYFTVSHQTAHSFVVHTRHAATRVLGTAFLVKSYAADSVTDVMVTDGKVALRQPNAQSSSGTTLVYGDLAHIDDAGMITVAHDLPIERYVEWSRGRLVYRDTPLGEILPDLEHWYGLTIVLRDPSLAKSTLTLTLDVESVEQAIASLSRVSGLTGVRVGNTVTLSREQQ
jgi:ferric-dicitrate binding protein FerR (iron transport regulator)